MKNNQFTTLAYGAELKKIQFKDITFNQLELNDFLISKLDGDYDEFDLIEAIAEALKNIFSVEVLQSIILVPKNRTQNYELFAFLKSREIVPCSIASSGSFKTCMEFFLKDGDENYKTHPLKDNEQKKIEIEGTSGISQNHFNNDDEDDYNPYYKTGKFLYNESPFLFNVEKITKEKYNYAKKLANTTGAEIDKKELKTKFNQLIKKHNLKPSEPINVKEKLKDFETLTGFKLPNELQTLFELHNGFDVGVFSFLSIDKIIQEWKNWKEIFDDPSWPLTELKETSKTDKNITVGLYTSPFWIPFYDNVGGNYYAIDYMPGKKGQSGQIIAIGRDEQTVRFIANDILSFLDLLIETAGEE